MTKISSALQRLFLADKALGAARQALDDLMRGVRTFEQRISDFRERLAAAQDRLRHAVVHVTSLETDIKQIDERITQLRAKQETSSNFREYQALVVEINTLRGDRTRKEEELLVAMEKSETTRKEVDGLSAGLIEQEKALADARSTVADTAVAHEREIARLQVPRDQAFADFDVQASILEEDARKAEVSSPDAFGGRSPLAVAREHRALARAIREALQVYTRIHSRHEDCLTPLVKPEQHEREFICGACSMSLIGETYNRLVTREEVVTCSNCARILFVPDDMTAEKALSQGARAAAEGTKAPRKPRSPRKKKAPAAETAAPADTPVPTSEDSADTTPDPSA